MIKVLTWNCNGAFRKKWSTIADLGADLLIIQECEDPSMSSDRAYQEWAGVHHWTGLNKSRGLGVFARNGLMLNRVPIFLDPLELFLPLLIDDKWPLLATWTKQANSPTFGYIGQVWKFLQSNREFLRHPGAMLVGDLNSNAKWDVWDRWWNHTDVVNDLADTGLRSVYHEHFWEAQGQEQKPTFYMQRKLNKPHHIDYVFCGSLWTARDVEIGSPEDWLQLSDHMPLIATLELNSKVVIAAA
ncbi:MAG: endonuclease/exonuclease/phosphatase family protein [Undibacterium umbellatum]|uniref:endonuclease/exonuclease/phosphatase family protein n=1 Tax=Undibacterium umbellatum TaxID=2762300 RepID=UPI003BB48A1D